MNGILTDTVIIVSFLAGSLFLQIYLSKKENRWLGLVLPCITFATSIVSILGITLFSLLSVQVVQSGDVITQSIEMLKALGCDMLSVALYLFVLYNIPTGALLLIYESYRKIEITTRTHANLSDIS